MRKPGADLATNTSSLLLEDLRTVLQRPERLVGIRFFNPVSMMPLVEVVEAARAGRLPCRPPAPSSSRSTSCCRSDAPAPGQRRAGAVHARHAGGRGRVAGDCRRSHARLRAPMGPIELIDNRWP